MSAIAGNGYKNLSTTVGTTQKNIANAISENPDVTKLLVIKNSNAAGNFWIGLAGETVTNGGATGFLLAVGDAIILSGNEAPQGVVTAVSDTSSLPLTIYAL